MAHCPPPPLFSLFITFLVADESGSGDQEYSSIWAYPPEHNLKDFGGALFLAPEINSQQLQYIAQEHIYI